MLGNASGFAESTQAHLASFGAAAAHINDQVPVRLNLPDGKLYIRSTVDAGADNEVSTLLILTEGVQD